MGITFSPRRQFGIPMYFSKDNPNFSIVMQNNRYYIRILENREWVYPSWDGAIDGFRTLSDAQTWLNKHDWENATSSRIDNNKDAENKYESDFIDAMKLLGLEKSTNAFYDGEDVYMLSTVTDSGYNLDIRVIKYSDTLAVDYWINNKLLPSSAKSADTLNISKTVRNIERMMNKYGYNIFANTAIVDRQNRFAVMAAASTKDAAKNLVKVRSSNVWAYGMNIKDRKSKVGDLLVQFKDTQGGPGDIYIYYDVPIIVYRRWQSAPSKGHYFWIYIRNNYKYSKLTGDKRGKLKNAIN